MNGWQAPGRVARRLGFLVCILASGCLAPSEHAPDPNPAAPVESIAFDLSRAEFNGCTFTSFESSYPGNTAPGAAPPGWEPSTRPLSILRMDFWDCEDIFLAGQH